MPRSLKERFWEKVNKGGPDDCWPWTAFLTPTGYGQIRVGDRAKQAHRVAWQLTYGEIPAGMFICHRCDNQSCCNPSHLFMGTHSDNMRDRAKKGRSAGEKNPNSRLSDEDVLGIVKIDRLGVFTQAEIGKVYGISEPAIQQILAGKTWSHLTSIENHHRLD